MLGFKVGKEVGSLVGRSVGCAVGFFDGNEVRGFEVGKEVGLVVGRSVGCVELVDQAQTSRSKTMKNFILEWNYELQLK